MAIWTASSRPSCGDAKRGSKTAHLQAAKFHRVEARALSQIIDIFAPPYTPEQIKGTKWFKVDEEPFQGRKGVFEAVVG